LSEANFPYKITFEAVSHVGPVADQVKQQLGEIKDYTFQVNVQTERVATVSTRSFRSLIFGTQMALWYTSMLVGGMLRAESATLMLEQAQENYRRAVEKYGPASYEAQRALRSLQRTQLYLQRSTMYTNLMTASFTLQMVSMAAQVTSVVNPSLNSLRAALTALKTTFAGLGPVGWAMLGLGTIATAIGTYMAWQSMQPQVNIGSINVATRSGMDLDVALEEMKRQVKNEVWRSMR